MKVVKILVVLMLMTGLVFVFFSLKAVSLIQTQKNVILSLQNGVSGQGETVGSLNVAVENARTRVNILSQEKQDLAATLGETESAMEEAKEERNEAVDELSKAQEAKDELTNALTTQDGKITDLKSLLKETETRITDLTESKIELENTLDAERKVVKEWEQAAATATSEEPGVEKSEMEAFIEEQKARQNSTHNKEMQSLVAAHDKQLSQLTRSKNKLEDELKKERKKLSEMSAKASVAGTKKTIRKKRVKEDATRGPAGTVTTVKGHGVTTVGFDGNVKLGANSTCKVVRDGETQGSFAIEDIFYTVFIIQQRQDIKNKLELQQGDIIKIIK